MENAKLEFPEVVGQVVSELTIYDDPISGREVLVRFSDGTQLSIAINVRQAVDARFCKEDTPDAPILIRR